MQRQADGSLMNPLPFVYPSDYGDGGELGYAVALKDDGSLIILPYYDGILQGEEPFDPCGEQEPKT